MKNDKKLALFRRHFFLISLTTIFLMLLVFGAFHLSRMYQKDQMLPPHIHFFVDLIGAVPENLRAETVARINQSRRHPEADKLQYLDKKGLDTLDSGQSGLKDSLPQEVGQVSVVEIRGKKSFLIRLGGEGYLLLEMRKPPFLFPFFMLFIIGAILVAAGISSILYYHFFSKMSGILEDMITKIKSGNLQARLKVEKRNEIGETKEKFNLMADEIEHLVKRIQDTETNRLKVLQQLAHDLRTPIASQKNLLETLKEKEASLDDSIKKEFVDLAIKEADYFGRLVEDLLFLAMLVEPHYTRGGSEVDLNEIARGLVKSYRVQDEITSRNLNLKFIPSDKEAYLLADPYHIERLLRNLLNNAVTYAKKTIQVQVSTSETGVALRVIDDGCGFENSEIENYGVKKFSRSEKNKNNQLSIGLGSVIVKAICDTLGGKLLVSNLYNEKHEIRGAQVCLEFSSVKPV